MPETLSLEQVNALAAQLPPAERLRLIARIAGDLATAPAVASALPRKWREIRGIVAFPMCGEDAQAWVTRTRREADERREIGCLKAL